jgi:hypothetical protein
VKMSWKLYLDAAGDTVGDTAGTGFGVAMGTTAASCIRHSNFTTETAAEMSKLPQHLFCLQPPPLYRLPAAWHRIYENIHSFRTECA